MTGVRLLVVGARGGSLGAAVTSSALRHGYAPYTAGIQGEQLELNLEPSGSSMERLTDVLRNVQPRHIVCTVGINMPEPMDQPDVFDWWRWHMEINCIAPMRLLEAWMRVYQSEAVANVGHYVAISSNSATIPRTNSAAYCASKAALSMALRVKAREIACDGPTVYGYEPGLLAGTPMTKKSEAAFAGPLHRMKPRTLAGGIDPYDLAELIVSNLGHHGPALNGSMIGYAADEL